jgi:3-oxoacyl-[acyl-carrier-protein] synthase II
MTVSDVMVTGLGAITPLGGDVASTWAALLAGKSGIRDEAEGLLAAAGLPVTVAAAMAADPAGRMTPVQGRRLDRSQQAALTAAAEAWADAGSPDADPDRFAVAIGTGIGGVTTLLRQDDVLESAGARRVSPRTVPMLMPNASAALISIEYGARAGAYTPVSACSSGAEAFALGARLIRSGDADVVIAGGSRPTGTGSSSARARVSWCLKARNTPPRAARACTQSSPALESPPTRTISPPPAPDGGGQVAAMRKALAQAGVSPSDVGHVNAHATGTPVGDTAEARAIRGIFGSGIPVTAPKASLGHLFGAAGAVEALIAILSVEHDVIPPTRNITDATVDPDIGLDIVTTAREASQRAAISNSFGFGGQNVSLLFAKPTR